MDYSIAYSSHTVLSKQVPNNGDGNYDYESIAMLLFNEPLRRETIKGMDWLNNLDFETHSTALYRWLEWVKDFLCKIVHGVLVIHSRFISQYYLKLGAIVPINNDYHWKVLETLNKITKLSHHCSSTLHTTSSSSPEVVDSFAILKQCYCDYVSSLESYLDEYESILPNVIQIHGEVSTCFVVIISVFIVTLLLMYRCIGQLLRNKYMIICFNLERNMQGKGMVCYVVRWRRLWVFMLISH